MTKSQLIETIAGKVPHINRNDVEVVINNIFDNMVQSLKSGDRVEIRGLGSFIVKHRRAREGRNPKSGEKVSVPEKRIPFFKAGKELKIRVDAK
jgi:integration host factor subunit beta